MSRHLLGTMDLTMVHEVDKLLEGVIINPIRANQFSWTWSFDLVLINIEQIAFIDSSLKELRLRSEYNLVASKLFITLDDYQI